MTETGDEARRRRVGQVNDKEGENRSSWIRRGRVEFGSSVGEVNPSSKCVDGAGSWDDATVFDQ